MVYFLTMSDKSLNIHEAKTHLSEHLAALGAGDRIILCRRNRPIAEIRPLERALVEINRDYLLLRINAHYLPGRSNHP